MPTPEQVVAAIKALYRVRAIEKPPDGEGLREVWHQAALGVELFSVVNAEGKLTQQELTLFNEVLHWSRRGGLRSGKFADPSAPDPVSGDGRLFDPALSPVRLKRAHEALCAYEGKDNYLLHFRDLLAAALEGKVLTADRVVSGVLPGDSQQIKIPRMTPSASRAKLLVAGILGGLLVALALWRLTR